VELISVKNFLILQAILVLLGVIYLRKRSPISGLKLKLRTSDRPSPLERNLNIHFNYNGHSWDAYEVLGVPAGSSPESVRKAYEGMLAKLDPESRELVELAYKAIRG